MNERVDNADAVNRLSARQLSCLRLVAELKKTEQIAAELAISPSTVNTHIERAMTILGARSRREAASMVARTRSDIPESGREESPTEFPRLVEPTQTQPIPLAAEAAKPARRNRLDVAQRLGLGFMALVFLCLAIAGLGAAIEQLSNWRSSLASAHVQHARR